MSIFEIESRIVEGVEPEENPADVLFMTHSIAEALWGRYHGRISDSFPIPPDLIYREEHALFAAGLLLCPIFDPVKHWTYSDKMVEARKRYRNVAQNPALRDSFRRHVRKAAEDGALASLQAAEKLKFWALLE